MSDTSHKIIALGGVQQSFLRSTTDLDEWSSQLFKIGCIVLSACVCVLTIFWTGSLIWFLINEHAVIQPKLSLPSRQLAVHVRRVNYVSDGQAGSPSAELVSIIYSSAFHIYAKNILMSRSV